MLKSKEQVQKNRISPSDGTAPKANAPPLLEVQDLMVFFENALALNGRILFQGEDITGTPPSERVKKGIVLSRERHPVFPESSVLENLRIAGYLKPRAQVKNS